MFNESKTIDISTFSVEFRRADVLQGSPYKTWKISTKTFFLPWTMNAYDCIVKAGILVPCMAQAQQAKDPVKEYHEKDMIHLLDCLLNHSFTDILKEK